MIFSLFMETEMFKINPVLSCVLLSFFVSNFAVANGDASLTYGTDRNGYVSYAFKGDVDILTKVALNLDHLYAETSGVVNTQQTGLGLTGYANDWLTGHYRYSETNDTVYLVKGNEVDMSFALDEFWQGELNTSLNFAYGSFDYGNVNPPPSGGQTLNQARRSVGLSQDISSSVNVYGSHDQYVYNRNLTTLIVFMLLRRTQNSVLAAFSFLSFPDTTNSLGLNWQASDNFSLDLSASKTITVFDQNQMNTRLGVDYQLSGTWNIGAAFTRNINNEILGKNGGVLQPASNTTFTEITASFAF